MSRRDFRILDKDLGRLTNAERAGLHSFRPLIRLGVAGLFVAFVVLASFSSFSDHPEFGVIVAGVAVAAYLALAIGGNDVANSLGPAVGAGAIGLTAGLVLVGMMQVAGAVLAGSEVTDRLTSGIVGSYSGLDGPEGTRIMVAALLAAATWISLATWAEAPVSTTHSVVGAIMGAGIMALGWDSVNWASLLTIAAGWIASPLVSGFLAALLLATIRFLVQDRPDPLGAARLWLPWFIALMTGFFVFPILTRLLGFDLAPAAWISLALASLAWLHSRGTITRQIAQHSKTGAALKTVFSMPLVAAALLMGFAHGSNDAANVTAPLGMILRGTDSFETPLFLWAPLMAGLGISAGALLFGRRLVHMVGSRITRLNASRAFCVSLATAITVLSASAAGLPVSTTHIAVGGVFGVGFFREWRDNRQARARQPLPVEETERRHLVRRSHMRTIFGAWLITVPAAALLGAGAVLLIA